MKNHSHRSSPRSHVSPDAGSQGETKIPCKYFSPPPIRLGSRTQSHQETFLTRPTDIHYNLATVQNRSNQKRGQKYPITNQVRTLGIRLKFRCAASMSSLICFKYRTSYAPMMNGQKFWEMRCGRKIEIWGDDVWEAGWQLSGYLNSQGWLVRPAKPIISTTSVSTLITSLVKSQNAILTTFLLSCHRFIHR